MTGKRDVFQELGAYTGGGLGLAVNTIPWLLMGYRLPFVWACLACGLIVAAASHATYQRMMQK